MVIKPWYRILGPASFERKRWREDMQWKKGNVKVCAWVKFHKLSDEIILLSTSLWDEQKTGRNELQQMASACFI